MGVCTAPRGGCTPLYHVHVPEGAPGFSATEAAPEAPRAPHALGQRCLYRALPSCRGF